VSTFFLDLSEALSRIGIEDAASNVKGFSSGTFGSGFVITVNGSTYIVTNYHVVFLADSVNLEFDKDDGTRIEISKCQVVLKDKKLDLALISFPKDIKPINGLDFSHSPILDGLEVWSAGYPGLAGEPAWQLGKGNITNSKARVPALIDPSISVLFQHSAQVDPGNSGGPLLISDASTPFGYSVIGVNTWKALGRQATNFAIPSTDVEMFLKRGLSNEAESQETGISLIERCKELSSAINDTNDDYTRLANFISDQFVLLDGRKVLIHTIRESPRQISSGLIDATSAEPFESARMAISYAMISETTDNAHKELFNFVSCDSGDPKSMNQVTARYARTGGKTVEVTWVFEDGDWRVSSFPLNAAGRIIAGADDGTEPHPKIAIKKPYRALLGAGFGMDDVNVMPVGSLFAGIQLSPYLQVGPLFRDAQSQANIAISGTEQLQAIVDVAGQVNAELPFVASRLTLVPYVGGAIGWRMESFNSMSSSSNKSGLLLIANLGLQIGVGTEPLIFLGGGPYYNFDTISSIGAIGGSLWVAVKIW
jgi:serine protease Do